MRKGNYFPDSWKIEKSQVYCDRVADGTHDTPKPVNEGKRLVTSKNIKQGQINFDDCYFISENDFININRRSKVDKGDVLFSMIGTVGEIALVKQNPDYAIKNIGLFKPKSYMDGIWLYYYLTSPIGQSALDTFLTGTSQQFVSLGDLRKVPIVFPPDKTKRKIAAILSTYDDLIENNNRRIAVLEKIAEELYREWFVRQRFPGHEKVEIVKGMPKGWEVKKVEDCFKTSSGGTPSRQKESTYYGGNIEWIKTGELKDTFIINTDEKITELGLKNSSAKLFPPFTLIMAMYGVNIGQLGITIESSSTNQACCAFLPICISEYSLYYLFFYLKSIREYLFNISMGAAQQNLSQDIIKRLTYIKPVPDLLTKFDKIQRSIFKRIVNLKKQNNLLATSRDRLLSRLMSGNIDVENMDIQFPASMKEEAAHA